MSHGRDLRPRQQRFVEEYLLDLNATQAAIRAGYSARDAHTQGYHLMKKASIREAVRQARAGRSERTNITADDMLRGIQDTIAYCLRGTPILDANGEIIDYEGNIAGALKGYELLGRHLGLWDRERYGPHATERLERIERIERIIIDPRDSESESVFPRP